MDAVFDLKFNVAHVDCAVSLKFQQTIFVLEDVDAASSVVLKRGEAAEEEAAKSPPPAIAADADPVSKLLALIAADDAATGATSTLFAPKLDADRLDLSGVLNVLDGVVDSPGRLLIMTTNHPEKLDPALVRPGRCDLHIHLGFLRFEEAAEMVRHYVLFGREMTPGESEAFATAWDARATRDVTPATLEQICAGADELAGVLAALARLRP